MVGLISLSLTTILERIAFARDNLGVRLFQISLPSWGALEDAEVRTFFDTVLGTYADCQFLHYNLLRTKRLVTAEEYARIAADHSNLVATKNSTDSMSRIRSLIETAPTLQHFLNERGYVHGSLVGECGLLISLAMLNFSQGQRFFDAGQRRDVGTLLGMEAELSQLGRKFQAYVGGGRAPIDGAFDKVLWWLHDQRFPLRLLPPYAGADLADAEAFAAFVRDNYPELDGVAAERGFVDVDAQARCGRNFQLAVCQLEWCAADDLVAERVFGHVQLDLWRVDTRHATGLRQE